MRIIYIIAILLGCYSVRGSQALASKKINITFINPGISDPNDPTGKFWLSVSSFMQAAAQDLNINLEIIYSERNHLLMQKQAREIANRQKRPDYLVIVNEKLAAKAMIKAADKVGIKVFMMLNVFRDKQAGEMRMPRQKYPNWIGTLIPDNHYAGYSIANAIIAAAEQQNPITAANKLALLAIAGDHVTQASIERVNGLKKAIAQHQNVTLKQVLVGFWRKDEAFKKTNKALMRYPKIGAIWAANDPMAIGAIEASELIKTKSVGKDIVFGGLNWDVPALNLIEKGKLAVSLGGHFMTGGWALVLLHDYHHKKDFKSEGVALKRKIFSVINKQNINDYLKRFQDRNWHKIDFTRFSKVLNPKITVYDFSLEAIMAQ